METKLSFSVDLFHNFEAVYQHSISRRKGGDEFISLLKDRADQEETYAKGLEKIGNHPYFGSKQGTLSQAISAMKNDSLNKAMQSRILYDNITHDLIDSFKELLKIQTNSIKLNMTQGKKLEKERLETIEKLDRSKMKYWKSCSDCEQRTIAIEAADPGPKRDKQIGKLLETKNAIDRNLKRYLVALATYNEFSGKYNPEMTKILEFFQEKEEERVSNMKDVLRKLVVYETACLRNLQYDIDNMAHAMESVNVQAEINNFVKENALLTPKQRLAPEEFIPYEGIHPSFQDIGKNPPAMTIPLPPEEIQRHIKENQLKRDAAEKYKEQLSSIIARAWAGEDLATEDHVQFNSIIKDTMGRRVLVGALSSRKLQGDSSICEKGFKQLSEFFLLALNECSKSRDISTIK